MSGEGERATVGRVTTLAGAWAATLALLAVEWTRTPLSGPGPAFLIWSLPALPLALLTWRWLRRLALGRLEVGTGALVLILLGWAAIGAATAAGLGAEWVLDGIVLRNPLQRAVGLALRWLPGVWGAALSVAGLAVALEARHRLAHPRAVAPSVGDAAAV